MLATNSKFVTAQGKCLGHHRPWQICLSITIFFEYRTRLHRQLWRFLGTLPTPGLFSSMIRAMSFHQYKLRTSNHRPFNVEIIIVIECPHFSMKYFFVKLASSIIPTGGIIMTFFLESWTRLHRKQWRFLGTLPTPGLLSSIQHMSHKLHVWNYNPSAILM